MPQPRTLGRSVALLILLLASSVGSYRATLRAQGPLCPGCGYVSVTPDGSYDPNRQTSSSGNTTTFTATNSSGSTITFMFSCWGTGGVSCTQISPTSKKLANGASITLNVTYSVGSGGGTIRADMEGGSWYDDGYRLVTTSPVVTVVLPQVTTADTALVHTRRPLIRATYVSNDAALDTTTLVVRWGTDTVTALTRRNRGLVEWQVDSARELTPNQTTDLAVKICHANGCTEVTRRVKLDSIGPPIVAFDGMPFEAYGAQFTAPFGPGLSVSGAEVQTGFGTPAYVSMGAARAVSLVYSTRQSYPRALVSADIELTWPADTPDQLKAVLLDGAVRLDSLVATSPTCQAAAGRHCRVTLQADFSGSTYAAATRKWLKVEVTVTSGATSKTTVDSLEAVLVDRRSTPYGSGWWVDAAVRLDSAGPDMLLVGPSGATTLFRGWNGVYLAPPGDRRILSWTGTRWELRGPLRGSLDKTKLAFDAAGRLIRAYTAYGDSTRVFYGILDRVDSIIDPVGKRLAFWYNASSKLDSIVDPGGRQTRVSINASNELVFDSLVGAPHRTTYSYTTYDGNNTLVLAHRLTALGDSTSVTYDATRRRPTQVALPAVLPDTGTTLVRPVITYRAQELRGLDTVLSADSVFVHITDPRGYWTRSRLTRWGAPERTWDALGTTARAAHTPDGRVLWSEGVVADSTRAQFVYDGEARLLRTFRLRAAGDTVLIDSLVYDSYDRVTTRFNTLRQATTYTYDNYGSVTSVITPSSDTTDYVYRSDGLLDRSQAPAQAGWTILGYDATWKNVTVVTNPSGVELRRDTFDAFGRAVESKRKVTIQVVNADTSLVQWRRALTWYLPTNQVDSVRTERTDTCYSPCTSPPSWPSAADTAKWQQVRHLYDRLGRDTSRVTTRGKRTRYAYDALGRLRARFPFADSIAVVDSFRYDVAGNLRFHRTRRATTIEHRYDSRNRDTLMIVPGIGTYRRTYAGPAGQLTRLWIENYVDSIGGVNPEVRWGYSQAGWVLADTSYTGTTVRAIAWQHDRYGRDSVVTDVAGTWRYRYDAVRGLLDTLVTPFADTLRWTYDARWRAVGPTIGNGSDPDYSVTASWDDAGKLATFATTHSVQLGLWEQPDDWEPNAPELSLRPKWTDRQGSGGPTVTWEDTLAHDGWGRVSRLAYLRNGSVFAADTFSFDRDGNLGKVGSELRSHDAATMRLVMRGLSAHTYTYDRAGNLVQWIESGGPTWTYQYDALDRLVAARRNDSLIVRYGYDALGRRIVKRTYTGATAGYLRMVYRGGQVAVETDSGGTATLAYTWGFGTDRLVAVRRLSDDTTWYAVTDPLGSVRALSRRDGVWVASWRYRAYGAVLDSAGGAPFALRYRWIGREYDVETGWYYLRARYYAPDVQRFVQEDPIGFVGGPNLYAYGDGNPTNGVDRDGLRKENPPPLYDPSNIYNNCFSADCSGGHGGAASDPWAYVDAVVAYNDRWRAQQEFTDRVVDYLRQYGGEAGALMASSLESGRLSLVITEDVRSHIPPSQLRGVPENQEVYGYCHCIGVDNRAIYLDANLRNFTQFIVVIGHEYFEHYLPRRHGHPSDASDGYYAMEARFLSSLYQNNAPGIRDRSGYFYDNADDTAQYYGIAPMPARGPARGP